MEGKTARIAASKSGSRASFKAVSISKESKKSGNDFFASENQTSFLSCFPVFLSDVIAVPFWTNGLPGYLSKPAGILFGTQNCFFF